MTLKTTREDLDTSLKSNGQQREYLILSEEERAKGFVRPVRTSYKHVGIPAPKNPLRDLTDEERERYGEYGYVKFEEYQAPPPVIPGQSLSRRILGADGRFWTQEELGKIDKGCGTVTTMAQEIAETYARSPGFYGGTFCAGCGTHLKVGEHGEFVWDGTDERVGT